jgi:hypothetical protein
MIRPFLTFVLFLVLAACPRLLASGQFWDFLGHTQIDGSQDHMRIRIVRPDLLYRTIQMRVSGEAIFLDRLVLHFDGKGFEEITVSGRISPSEKSYMIELPQEGRAVESVEVWYYQEPWGHTPRVSLYGLRKQDTATATIAEKE